MLLTGSPSNVEPHALRRSAERSRHAARSASRRDDAAADPAGDRGGHAAARGLPRLPGDERRLRRHALAEGAGGARACAITARTRSIRSRCSTRPRTRWSSCRAASCTRIAGTDRVTVNSLHSQGVQTLGDGLAVEARAPDGLIEAFRVPRGAGLRARGAVAPRVAGDEEPIFARAVRRVRRRRRGRTPKDDEHEHARSSNSSRTTASPRSRPSSPTWPASRAAR